MTTAPEAAGFTTAPAPSDVPATPADHRPIATVDSDDLPESSGIVAGRVNPDVYWTHNDSGGGPYVWAVRLTPDDQRRRIAPVLGSVQLVGATSHDWEDIAWGPGDYLYILDGGDNPPCERTDKRIHRFLEPRIDPQALPLRARVVCESMRFEYPDPQQPDRLARANEHRYDAECLLVHPAEGDIYIVTKRNNRGDAVARVYRLPGRRIRWNQPGALHVLEFVTDLTRPARQLPGLLAIAPMITGGDIDASGTRVVLRDYVSAREFILPPGQPFERIFLQPARVYSLIGELVGEGICYSHDARVLITTSEVQAFGLTRCPIFMTPCASGEKADTAPAGK